MELPGRKGEEMIEPVLASTLIGHEELDTIVDEAASELLGERKRRDLKHRLTLGVKSVDEVLDGGIEEGVLMGISGEGVDLSLALMAASLVGDEASTAAVIDTTGNIDVLRIYTFILSRLKSTAPFQSEPESEIEDVAAKILDRVKIMRVFDLEGVVEAVGEIREGLTGQSATGKTQDKDDIKVTGETKGEQDTTAKKPEESMIDKPLIKKTVIADSEDEDEDEDEMLFDTEHQYTTIATPTVDRPTELQPLSGHLTLDEDRDPNQMAKTSFILIDNLSHVTTSLLKKNHTQATALSTSFLIALANLTHDRTLRTLLLNPCTPKRTSTSGQPGNAAQGLPPHQNQPQPQPQQQYSSTRHPPPSPSIFTSNTAIPPFLNILPPYLDLHLLVSKLPLRQADAKLWYTGDAQQRRRADMVSVVEVLSDRYARRLGAWGAFRTGDHGLSDV
ncbi:hypothetical protein BS50DRAFT_633563 [Corynespora cassiicola Philippines]|uniref:DNA recombination and repair protein Rad51-like C-terminal domain-containing protein n=1 Tax=Corynespora cassiicola Philippines TaxID=1448308 RepID=A0A2T2NRA2_CORCC|nr:hypothetical protein BS50DRAFT_633563 [Corynespora cassiicola Philippines]